MNWEKVGKRQIMKMAKEQMARADEFEKCYMIVMTALREENPNHDIFAGCDVKFLDQLDKNVLAVRKRREANSDKTD